MIRARQLRNLTELETRQLWSGPRDVEIMPARAAMPLAPSRAGSHVYMPEPSPSEVASVQAVERFHRHGSIEKVLRTLVTDYTVRILM